MAYLFAAYTIIWTMVFWYVLAIGKRQKKIEKDITYLKSILK